MFAGGFDGGAGALARSMDRGRVGEFGREIGKHRVENGGFDGRGGVEIEVDAVHMASHRILLVGNCDSREVDSRQLKVEKGEKPCPSMVAAAEPIPLLVAIATPTPGGFLQRVRNRMKINQLSFWRVRKSAKESKRVRKNLKRKGID